MISINTKLSIQWSNLRTWQRTLRTKKQIIILQFIQHWLKECLSHPNISKATYFLFWGTEIMKRLWKLSQRLIRYLTRILQPSLQLIHHTGLPPPPSPLFSPQFLPSQPRSCFLSQSFPFRSRFQGGFRQYDRSFRRGRIPCFHCGGFNHFPKNCYQKRDFSRDSRRKLNNVYPVSKPKGE